jgi:hypothetical protein
VALTGPASSMRDWRLGGLLELSLLAVVLSLLVLAWVVLSLISGSLSLLFTEELEESVSEGPSLRNSTALGMVALNRGLCRGGEGLDFRG